MTRPEKALSRPEFVALIAMLFAMVAFSIDAMLPALPEIADAITPADPNRAQLVITSFVFGMGLGTFFTGPLSDTFGRKPVIIGGAILYCIGAIWGAFVTSVEEMVLARVVQGLGVAGPRIVALAIIRDLYEGRPMAQIMSFAMLIFTLVPAIAPALGALIIAVSGWRAIFFVFVIFCAGVTLWLALRQPETHPVEKRTPFRAKPLWAAVKRCLSDRLFVSCAAALSMTFGMLFAELSSIHQIFDEIYGKADSFPFWFAVIAVIGGSASILNARLVMRFGMGRMILIGLFGQALITGGVLIFALTTGVPFAMLIFWCSSLFFMVGFVIGNLNALAMGPVGDIAGMAASILGSVATVIGALIAIPIGLAFDGTPVPLAISILALSLASGLTVYATLRGQLSAA